MNGKYQWNYDKYETVVHNVMEILYSPKTVSYELASYEEMTQGMEMFDNFQELVKNSQELAMTLQNFIVSTLHHEDVVDFLMNTLQHYLLVFGVHLDNPVQLIHLIR